MYVSEYADVATVDEPLHDAVLGGAAARGDTPALVDGTAGTTLTYAGLDQYHRKVAAGLAEAGVREGDVVALHSPNTIVYPVAFFGITRAGAAVTTVHPLSTPQEFARQLRDAGAGWIITVTPLVEVARTAAELAGGVREIFVCDPAGDSGHRSLTDLLHTTAPEPDIAVDPADDVAALPYSSGTTGTPKGVMLTHRNIATNLAQIEPAMSPGFGDRVLAVLPFFHIYGITVIMSGPLRQGATLIVLPRFDIDTFLAAIEKHRVSHLYVAPPIVLALAKHPAVERYDLSSLRNVTSAAAPLDGELARACARRLGLPHVGQGYGMTELSPASHAVAYDAERPPPGAVGKPLPSTETRIVSLDDPAKDVAPGEPGEVLIRGPQVMKGYLGRPDATADMIDADGWVHTGDVGRVDADGWLFVVDRVKELIKYKGYQVAPAELEALLLSHEGIADAAVIGVLDEDGNEIPKAFVVRADSALGEADVMAYVAERVAPYKKIRRVAFVDMVPRAASGKILRRELREFQ
ncbi:MULTISPECIES: 4-coumarate--CoA ligase family protein [unclassified Streptomyces]|uniref:4-coumarate--CoA ligase family protein n=1 Tax=unclassified Streptomyces TaxID=2593676 RepID=UPI00278BF3AF|nr:MULTISPECIES: 4-coumarate--CoA ligase family protein [unclassified Streptomyces]